MALEITARTSRLPSTSTLQSCPVSASGGCSVADRSDSGRRASSGMLVRYPVWRWVMTTRRTSEDRIPSCSSCGPISLAGSTCSRTAKRKTVPAWEVAALGDPSSLAGVDDDHTLGVLDRQGVDRKRLRPPAVKERVHES